MSSPGRIAYQLAYEISPIIFTGGIASGITFGIPGGALPIVLITQSLSFVEGLLSGGADLDLDDFFAHFLPLAGSRLVSNQFGKYPFANQAVAANARIKQPLPLSLKMICPARPEGGWALKLATMTALKYALDQHDALGGTYTVATPSFFYTNCVLLDLVDTSAGASMQVQNTYQWDFEQPLLTLQDAQQAQNSLMSQITGGLPISGAPAWSGLAPTVGNTASLGSVGLVPAASGAAGVQTATSVPPIGDF